MEGGNSLMIMDLMTSRPLAGQHSGPADYIPNLGLEETRCTFMRPEGFRKSRVETGQGLPSMCSGPGIRQMRPCGRPCRLIQRRGDRGRCCASQEWVHEELLEADALHRVPSQQLMKKLLAHGRELYARIFVSDIQHLNGGWGPHRGASAPQLHLDRLLLLWV